MSRGNQACQTRMLAAFWNLENDKQQTVKWAALYTAADRWPTNQIST